MMVDVNEVRRLRARLDEINAVPFDEVRWTDGGRPLAVPADVAEEWRFTGLTNTHFVLVACQVSGKLLVADIPPPAAE